MPRSSLRPRGTAADVTDEVLVPGDDFPVGRARQSTGKPVRQFGGGDEGEAKEERSWDPEERESWRG